MKKVLFLLSVFFVLVFGVAHSAPVHAVYTNLDGSCPHPEHQYHVAKDWCEAMPFCNGKHIPPGTICPTIIAAPPPPPEPDKLCPGGGSVKASQSCPNICGDGIKKSSEICDEGKDKNGNPKSASVHTGKQYKEYCSASCDKWVPVCESNQEKKGKPRAQVGIDQTIDIVQRCGEKQSDSDQQCELNQVNAYYENSTIVAPQCPPTRGCAPALQCEKPPIVDVSMYVEGQKVSQLYLSDLLYRMAQLRVMPAKEYADYDRESIETPKEHEKKKEIPRFYVELSVKSTIFFGGRHPVTSGPVAFYMYDDGGKNCFVLQDEKADDNIFSAQVGIVGDQGDKFDSIPQNFSPVCAGETEFLRWAKYQHIINDAPPTGEQLASKIGRYLGNTLRIKVYRKKGEPEGAPPLAYLEIPIEGDRLTRPNVLPAISIDAIREYGLDYIKTISVLFGPDRLGPDRKSVPALILDHVKDSVHAWMFTPEQTSEGPARVPSIPPAPPMPHRVSNPVEQYVLDNGLFPRGQCDLASASNAGRCSAAFDEMKREAGFQYSSPPKVMVGEIGGITDASGAVVIKKMPNGSIYVLTAPGYNPEQLKTRINEFSRRNCKTKDCVDPWP